MVYIISDGEYKKIGVSNDETSFQMRLTMLQGGNARKFKVLNRINGDYKTEAMLHRTLKNYRVFREWFKFDFNIDQELIEFLYDIDNKCENKKQALTDGRKRSLKLKNIKIIEAIKNLESKKKFISDKDISEESGIPIKSITRSLLRFKDRINNHNIKFSGTSDYNEFISNESLKLIKSSINELREKGEKVNHKKISLLSGLHRNTISRILKKNNINIKK